ncbi:MAG: hypothetical protein H6892_09415 [Brucellaceae bacterium]|nr:hypothetical protein [Brucellaceae bacterium]
MGVGRHDDQTSSGQPAIVGVGNFIFRLGAAPLFDEVAGDLSFSSTHHDDEVLAGNYAGRRMAAAQYQARNARAVLRMSDRKHGTVMRLTTRISAS